MKVIKAFPHFKLKAVTFSFDDGVVQDLEMINILNYFNLKATFNVNTNLMGRHGDYNHPQWLKNYRIDEKYIKDFYKDHELAAHSSNHSDFKDQSDKNLDIEITNDIKHLEKLIEKPVIGFAYPYGIYSDSIINKLKENNIIYARSVNSTFNFDIPTNWFTYGGSICMSDSKLEQLAKEWLSLKPSEMKMFYIWGHSFELDMYHEHERFYYFLETIAKKEDTYYATNGEIFSYLKELNKLIIDDDVIKNNSDIDLYLIIDGKNIVLPAKEQLRSHNEKK